MAEPGDFEIIAGVGNEVFYFFVVVVLCILVLLAWSSTQVVEPVVQSVILVERTAVGGATAQASSAEEVREAVTQFLQRQPEEEVEVEDWSASGGERNGEAAAGEVEDGEREVQQVEQVVPEQELPEEERVTIRLKFLNETQKEVEASLVENLGQFKRRNFTEEIGNNKNVRLIFNGQVLRDEGSSLRSCGLFDKCVVHCLVSNLPSSSGPNSQQQASAADHHHHHNQGAGAHGGHHHQVHHHHHVGQALDVSAFFIPLLGLALAMVWYLALAYNSYFNFMSTTALLGLTSLYFLSVYGTHFHVNVAVRTAVPQ